MSMQTTVDGAVAAGDPTLLQVQNRLWQLTAQLDQLQNQVAELRAEAGQSTVQVNALVEALTATPLLQPLHERLATLVTALDATQEQLTTISKSVAAAARQGQVEQLLQSVARQPQLERLIEVVAGQAALDELADSVKKLTRTQFKANTLAESKEQQVENALNTLREIATRRNPSPEQQPTQNSQQLATARREARAEFAAELLPALDSVELAFTNGLLLLERQQAHLNSIVTQQATPPPVPPAIPMPGFWQRLFGATAVPVPVVVQSGLDPQAVQAVFTTVKDAFTAWLRGLELVSDRFTALLAKEEIHPIAALHQPFDPRLHVAVETEARSDVEPNTVVRVLRRGYRQPQRVLRYAEVVVARAPKQ